MYPDVMQREYYLRNGTYADYLDRQGTAVFQKYAERLVRHSSPGSAVLDVGCGTGLALQVGSTLAPDRHWRGAEISLPSVAACQTKGLPCDAYDGVALPYDADRFAVVGSYNVLEHTDDPEAFLDEQLRVLRPGGFLIAVCPNFLSVTNSYHHRTRGLARKLRNLAIIARKAFSPRHRFEKMETVERPHFQPDDDACVVTNPLDIRKWARARGLKARYWSAQSVYCDSMANYLDRFPFKPFLGSSFFVFQKPTAA